MNAIQKYFNWKLDNPFKKVIYTIGFFFFPFIWTLYLVYQVEYSDKGVLTKWYHKWAFVYGNILVLAFLVLFILIYAETPSQ